MQVLPLYASILALLFVGLSVRTLRLRRRLRIAVGDAGNAGMLRAMRVHANFSEYVPLCLVLLFLVETGGANKLMLHVLGAGLVAGRFAHAYGVSQEKEDFRFRVFGMVMTFFVLVSCAILLAIGWLRNAAF